MRSMFLSLRRRSEASTSRSDRSSKVHELETQCFAGSNSKTSSDNKTYQKPRVFRLGRYYIEFGQLSPAAEAAQPLPELSTDPSECSFSELPAKLPATLFQELPSPASTMPTASNENNTYELDGYPPVNSSFQNDSITTGSSIGLDTEIQSPNRFTDSLPMSRQMYQELPPVAIPDRQAIDGRRYGPPSLISAESSHTPSPLTPIMPELAAECHIMRHQQPNTSPANNFAPSCQLFSPSTDQAPCEKYHYHPAYERQCLAAPESFAMSTRGEESSDHLRTMPPDYFHTYQNPHFTPEPRRVIYDFPPHQRLSYESPVAGQHLMAPMFFNPADVRVMGIGHTNETAGPYLDPNRSLAMARNIIQHHTHIYSASSPSRELNYFTNHSQHQSCHDAFDYTMRDSEALANARQNLAFPDNSCDSCGATFTGRYSRGNLTRHIRDKHDLSQSSTDDKTCRVCKKVYQRGDARRKHEWKKHRMPDAKPRKRMSKG